MVAVVHTYTQSRLYRRVKCQSVVWYGVCCCLGEAIHWRHGDHCLLRLVIVAYSELMYAAVGYCRLHDSHFMQYTAVMAIQYNTIRTPSTAVTVRCVFMLIGREEGKKNTIKRRLSPHYHLFDTHTHTHQGGGCGGGGNNSSLI